LIGAQTGEGTKTMLRAMACLQPAEGVVRDFWRTDRARERRSAAARRAFTPRQSGRPKEESPSRQFLRSSRSGYDSAGSEVDERSISGSRKCGWDGEGCEQKNQTASRAACGSAWASLATLLPNPGVHPPGRTRRGAGTGRASAVQAAVCATCEDQGKAIRRLVTHLSDMEDNCSTSRSCPRSIVLQLGTVAEGVREPLPTRRAAGTRCGGRARGGGLDQMLHLDRRGESHRAEPREFHARNTVRPKQAAQFSQS